MLHHDAETCSLLRQPTRPAARLLFRRAPNARSLAGRSVQQEGVSVTARVKVGKELTDAQVQDGGSRDGGRTLRVKDDARRGESGSWPGLNGRGSPVMTSRLL